MYDGASGDGSLTQGPVWDPTGTQPFRMWLRVVTAWLNVTNHRMTPTAQAAAIQLGLRGIAREYALALPPQAITFGARVNGVATDPVTYLLYSLGTRFEQLEEERTVTSGTQIIDFRSRPGERIDAMLTRFDMARQETASVGADLQNYHLLFTFLIRQIHSFTEYKLPNIA